MNDASTWNHIFRQQTWGQYPSEDLIRFIARHYYEIPKIERRNIRVLELGCGPGTNLWYLSREGFTPYGIDFSETAIAQAQERLRRENMETLTNLQIGDITKLPYPDNYFDAIIDMEAIYCNPWERSQTIFRQCWRVLKPGGRLFSKTFARGSYGDETGEPAGHHAWKAAVGPLRGKGISRFTALDEIPALIAPLEVVEINLVTRTVENRKNVIKEWLIEAIKNPSR